MYRMQCSGFKSSSWTGTTHGYRNVFNYNIPLHNTTVAMTDEMPPLFNFTRRNNLEIDKRRNSRIYVRNRPLVCEWKLGKCRMEQTLKAAALHIFQILAIQISLDKILNCLHENGLVEILYDSQDALVASPSFQGLYWDTTERSRNWRNNIASR